MKKFAFVLSLIVITSAGAYAFVDNTYMTTGQFLHNTGYSDEVSRMIDVTSKDPYAPVENKNNENIWRRIHNYLVPGINTDLDFYGHDGNFNNPSWKDL